MSHRHVFKNHIMADATTTDSTYYFADVLDTYWACLYMFARCHHPLMS